MIVFWATRGPYRAWLSAIDGQISVAIANLYIRGLAIGLWYVCPHGGVFLRRTYLKIASGRGRAISVG
jgi:hypothetical protein